MGEDICFCVQNKHLAIYVLIGVLIISGAQYFKDITGSYKLYGFNLWHLFFLTVFPMKQEKIRYL